MQNKDLPFCPLWPAGVGVQTCVVGPLTPAPDLFDKAGGDAPDPPFWMWSVSRAALGTGHQGPAAGSILHLKAC